MHKCVGVDWQINAYIIENLEVYRKAGFFMEKGSHSIQRSDLVMNAEFFSMKTRAFISLKFAILMVESDFMGSCVGALDLLVATMLSQRLSRSMM